MTKGIFKRLAAIPVPAILFVLALGLVVFGVGVMFPSNDILSPVSETVWGLGYIALGVSRIAGVLLKKEWLTDISPTLIMMGYLFLAGTQLAVVGWTPIFWLPLLLCAMIAGICRLALSLGRE